jgi:hypothetical protein
MIANVVERAGLLEEMCRARYDGERLDAREPP